MPATIWVVDMSFCIVLHPSVRTNVQNSSLRRQRGELYAPASRLLELFSSGSSLMTSNVKRLIRFLRSRDLVAELGVFDAIIGCGVEVGGVGFGPVF